MPLTVYRRGKIWHYRGTVAGRLLRGSTGTANKATAQRIAAEKEARQWKGNLDGPEAVLTFAQAAISYRKAGKPTRFLDKIEDHWKDAPVKDITKGAIRQAAILLYPHGSGATRNRQVIVPTQAIINHAASLDLCRTIRVPRFPVIKTEKEPATWGWVQAFMAEASPHLGALACFMLLTGARISEALAVTWDDVDLAKRRALIRQTKIGAERWAHLPPPLVAAIANIDRWAIPAAPARAAGILEHHTVFKFSSPDTVKPQWEKATRKAGIKALTPHCCRHGFATAMLQAGVDPVTTAKRGGWKSPQHVFATYGHAMDDETVTNRIIDTPEAQRVPISLNSGTKSVS